MERTYKYLSSWARWTKTSLKFKKKKKKKILRTVELRLDSQFRSVSVSLKKQPVTQRFHSLEKPVSIAELLVSDVPSSAEQCLSHETKPWSKLLESWSCCEEQDHIKYQSADLLPTLSGSAEVEASTSVCCFSHKHVETPQPGRWDAGRKKNNTESCLANKASVSQWPSSLLITHTVYLEHPRFL